MESEAGGDGDGEIAFEEFKKLWRMMEEEAMRAADARQKLDESSLQVMSLEDEGSTGSSRGSPAPQSKVAAPAVWKRMSESADSKDMEAAEATDEAVLMVANMFQVNYDMPSRAGAAVPRCANLGPLCTAAQTLAGRKRTKTWLDSKPLYTHLDKSVLKKGSNQHLSLFWDPTTGGKAGPHIILGFYRFIMLTAVILASAKAT